MTELRSHLEYKQQDGSSGERGERLARKFGLRRDVDVDLVLTLSRELATVTHTSWDRKYPEVGPALDAAKETLDALMELMLDAWREETQHD